MRVRSAASPGSVPSTARGVFGGPGAALARRQMEVLLGARLRRPPAQAARDDGLGLRGDEDHRVSGVPTGHALILRDASVVPTGHALI